MEHEPRAYSDHDEHDQYRQDPSSLYTAAAVGPAWRPGHSRSASRLAATAAPAGGLKPISRRREQGRALKTKSPWTVLERPSVSNADGIEARGGLAHRMPAEDVLCHRCGKGRFGLSVAASVHICMAWPRAPVAAMPVLHQPTSRPLDSLLGVAPKTEPRTVSPSAQNLAAPDHPPRPLIPSSHARCAD